MADVPEADEAFETVEAAAPQIVEESLEPSEASEEISDSMDPAEESPLEEPAVVGMAPQPKEQLDPLVVVREVFEAEAHEERR